MDQSPLPRGSFQVRDRFGEELRVVPELPEAAVAVEAQYPAHPAGAMIVIDVLGSGAPAMAQRPLPSREAARRTHRAVPGTVSKPQ
jgi:hypothetical protein